VGFLLPVLILLPVAGAFAAAALGRKSEKGRNICGIIITAAEFFIALYMSGKNADFGYASFCGLGINLKCGGFRGVLTVLTCFIWLITTLFSAEYFKAYKNKNRYYFFMLLTLGATVGVFLSADFYSLLIFFEIMSFTSYVLVVHDETSEALYAGGTYITVAVLGGLVTLAGLFYMYHLTGTLDMRALEKIVSAAADKRPYYVAGVLILTGFAAKAGAFPLHIWLPLAHPVAPAPASAILSCVLTKTGIFGVCALSCQVFAQNRGWGLFILIIGTITMVIGAVLALFSINLKRTLACSSLSQIGFILVGIGMNGLLGHENTLAAAGTAMHIINHSVIKCMLFMCAGIIYMNTHKLDLNSIRGWGKNKPFLKAVFAVGFLGIGGIPLFGGYISKTLLHESIVEYMHILSSAGVSTVFMKTTEILFLVAGGFTLAYMLKLYMAIFMEKPDNEISGKYMNKATAFSLCICAAAVLVFGIMPAASLEIFADSAAEFMNSGSIRATVHYFAAGNLFGAVISVAIGAVCFAFSRKCLMRTDESGNKVYIDAWPKWLDIEKNIYRPLLKGMANAGAKISAVVSGLLENTVYMLLVIAVIIIRFLTDTAQYAVDIIMNIFMNKKMPQYGEKSDIGDDVYFSEYSPEFHDEEKGYRENLSGALVLFGLGMVLAMLYIIV